MLNSLKGFLHQFHESRSASLASIQPPAEQHPQEKQTVPNYFNAPHLNPGHEQTQPNGHHAVADTLVELDLMQSSLPTQATHQLEYYLQQAEHLTAVGQFQAAANYYRQAIELQSSAIAEEAEPENIEPEDAKLQDGKLEDPGADTTDDPSTFSDTQTTTGRTFRVTVANNYAVVSQQNAATIEPVSSSHCTDFTEVAAQIQQAQALCEQQQWQDAIDACQSAVQFLEPYSATAYRLLGLALQSQKRLTEAEQSYIKSLTLQPEIAETHARLGSVCAEQQRLEESVNFYEQALELDPKFAGAYLKLGAVWQQLGDPTQAVDCWYQAAQLEPDWITVHEHVRLGNRLAEQNKLEAALWCYQQAIAFDANCAEAYYSTAEVLGQQGNWQAAKQHHQQATQLISTTPKFHLGLGRSLAKLEQWQDAIACYQQVTTLNADYAETQEALQQLEVCQRSLVAEFYSQQATKLIQQEQWQAAAHASQQAIDRNPQSAKFQASLGQSLAKLRQWQPALNCYREAVRLAPEATYTKALIDLLMQLGHLEEAARYYSKLLAPTSESAEARSIALEATPVSHSPTFAMF